MFKMIKVDNDTHRLLKVGASNQGVSMKKFIQNLAINNEEGVFFDVDKFSVDNKLSVLLDIVNSFKYDKFNDEHKSYIVIALNELSDLVNKEE